ncbi:hypothetical protein [Leifsonia shinshuensis]|uniref:Uncharacterized protein n=1 Tax=Leifsonia shinshuensis TaxID=150026 RepID=A0A853CZU4_9MICO|nr:hypothetical protein [Leifsonia shinshuensis]NYJ24821.1 hypothetical protein [Leifsonia shinshuensis]
MTTAQPAVSSDAAPTLDSLISDGLRQAKSEFQKEVLTKARETGSISEADWKEANNRYKACLDEQGYAADLLYDGSKVLMAFDADSNESEAAKKTRQAADLACYQKTSAFINEVYAYLNGGSDRPDADAVQRAVLACLIDRKLVPADTSYDQFLADLEQNEGKQFGAQSAADEEAVTKCWIENT